MYEPQDDDGKCHQCGRDYDSHTDERHDECDLKDALEEMPKDGLRFLVYRSAKDITLPVYYGAWDWIDLDGLQNKKFEFVKMAIMDGEILEDLG